MHCHLRFRHAVLAAAVAGSLYVIKLSPASGATTTTLSSGTLTVTDPLALADTDLILQGGTLDLRQDMSGTFFQTNSITLGSSSTIVVGSPGSATGNTLEIGAISSSGSSNNLTVNTSSNYTLKLGVITMANSAGGTVSPRGTAAMDIGGFTSLAGTSKIATLNLNGTVAGNIVSGTISDGSAGGKTALVKSNTGTWTLSGNNTFTGGVTIQGGILRINSSSALNSTAPNNVGFTLTSPSGTLQLNGFNTTVSNLSATTGAAAYVENASATDASLTVNETSQTTFGGVLRDGTGGGKLSVVKTGSATLVLTGNNTYTGATTINAGAIKLGVNDALAVGSALTVNGGSSAILLDMAGFNQTVAQLSGGSGTTKGSVTNSSGTSILTVTGTSQFDGILKDGGTGKTLSLIKSTGGTLTLTGANTYIGSTTVSGGTLAVIDSGELRNTSGIIINGGNLNYSSAVALNKAVTFGTNGGSFIYNENATGYSGGTLNLGSQATVGGSGKILSSIIVGNGGTISPGNSVGKLNTGSQVWAGGGSYLFEIDSLASDTNTGVAGVHYDTLGISGDLDLSGLNPSDTFVVDLNAGALSGWDGSQSYQWILATWTGSLMTANGFDATAFQIKLDHFDSTNDSSGGSFYVSQSGQSLILNYSAAVPEPMAFGILSVGLAAMILRRTRV